MTGVVDTALDRAVVPGYTKIGYWLRRPGWDRDDPRPGSLTGKRALVTGGSSGLGKASALGLARLGAVVHLVVRNEERGREALVELRGEHPAHLHEEAHEAGWSDQQLLEAIALVSLESFTAMVNLAGEIPVDGSVEETRVLRAA